MREVTYDKINDLIEETLRKLEASDGRDQGSPSIEARLESIQLLNVAVAKLADAVSRLSNRLEKLEAGR